MGANMADVKVRKLDDWVVATIRTRAQRAGRSLEQELRRMLTEAVLNAQRDFGERAAALRRDLRKRHGILADSTPGIREDRESRG